MPASNRGYRQIWILTSYTEKLTVYMVEMQERA